MRVSDRAYVWTLPDGKVAVSLFPKSRENRPRNIYSSRDEAYAAIYARRHRLTHELAYPEIVWED